MTASTKYTHFGSPSVDFFHGCNNPSGGKMTFGLDCIDCHDIVKQDCLEEVEVSARAKGVDMASNGRNCRHVFRIPFCWWHKRSETVDNGAYKIQDTCLT